MPHPAEHRQHPQHLDWRAGLEDGTEFNPYPHPYDRSGEALAAYQAGYAFGLECIEHDYFDTMVEKYGDPQS